MIETLKTLSYNKKLIKMLLEAKSGAIAVNIFGPLFFYYLFSSTIPNIYLILFIALQISLFYFRTRHTNKLYNSLDSMSTQEANRSLKTHLYFIFASSLLWGASTMFVIAYGTEIQIFTIMALIFVMLAGALSTLTPVYHAVFIFNVNILIPFTLTLLLMSPNDSYYIVAVYLIVFSFVTIPSSFNIYKSTRDFIIKNEEIHTLNSELEKRVQSAIQETKKREKLLQEQSRLAQMGEMISMIAHQWRQPLGAISSAVFSIETKKNSGKYDFDVAEDRKKYFNFTEKKLENINTYVQVLSTTIDDFRNFFKPDKTKEYTPLCSPVTKALQIVESSMSSKNIQIITDFQSNESIFMYQNEMMQVILNILKNAEDNFLEKKVQNPKISVVCEREDDSLIISICDNGGGIPKDILPKIFDPYFSTKEEKNGTGLGLYMSKLIIEEHNDGIFNAINTGNGVCFEIILRVQNG